jgi:hypothetical protein
VHLACRNCNNLIYQLGPALSARFSGLHGEMNLGITMNSSKITQAQYDRLFKEDEKILEKALEQAYKIRIFEIDLYRKRATYFWKFIGAAFVGYAAFFNATSNQASTDSKREIILVLIACIGFVFSVA